MLLTFSRTEFGSVRARDEVGATLFTIGPSTSRTSTVATIRPVLPGLKSSIPFELDGSESSYQTAESREVMTYVARILQRWVARHLGLCLAVTVVDEARGETMEVAA